MRVAFTRSEDGPEVVWPYQISSATRPASETWMRASSCFWVRRNISSISCVETSPSADSRFWIVMTWICSSSRSSAYEATAWAPSWTATIAFSRGEYLTGCLSPISSLSLACHRSSHRSASRPSWSANSSASFTMFLSDAGEYPTVIRESFG